MNKSIFLFLIFFTIFSLTKASTCFNLGNTGNVLSIGVIPNTNYAAAPFNIWTTAEVTISWSTSLGASVITGVNAQNGFPFSPDGPVETVGLLHFQKFGFSGAAHSFSMNSGALIKVLQITVEHASIATGQFAIVESPPVVGGTASFTNVFGDQFSTGGCNLLLAAVPLPVDLIYFKAEKKNKIDVLLSWQTAIESNSSHFELERSFDTKNWTRINKQTAAGNSSQLLDYHFLDKEIGVQKGVSPIVYYRLKMVDFDDTYEYSEIRKIIFKPTSAIRIFPNPAIDQFVIEIENQTGGKATLELVNQMGQIVLHEDLQIERGLSRIEINSDEYPNGAYQLLIRSDSFNFNEAIIFQK